MVTPDGWQVELVRFDGEPRFRVTCVESGHPRSGVLVTLDQLVSVLGDSFELLDPGCAAA
jgi:hypothetical protein